MATYEEYDGARWYFEYFGITKYLISNGTTLPWNNYEDDNKFDMSKSPQLDEWEWEEYSIFHMSESESFIILYHLIMKYKK